MAQSTSETTSNRILFPKAENVHQRLDRFLNEAFPERSRSQIQKWIRDQSVLIDGQPAKASYKIRGKEQIEVQPSESTTLSAVAEAIPLDIFHEDDDLAVINKPAGMVVHVGAGVHKGTLVNALLHHFGGLSRSGGVDRPGIVHRLDKQTSGLIVVARNDFSHLSLSRQFQSRNVTKKYIALVHGEVEKNFGEIRTSIGRDRVHRIRMSTRAPHAREAYTSFRVQERFQRFTLLELNIRTGRTHQIRVHLSSIRHPVVGDTLYGAPNRILLPGNHPPIPTLERNFLHAASLEFTHPRSEQPMHFRCDLPLALSEFLAQLRHS